MAADASTSQNVGTETPRVRSTAVAHAGGGDPWLEFARRAIAQARRQLARVHQVNLDTALLRHGVPAPGRDLP